MAQLPDLKAKLKVDFADADLAVAKAKLLGDALERELGGSKAASVDNSMKRIGSSVEDAGRKLQGAGTAFVKWGDAGQAASIRISSTTAKTKADFDELERRTKALASTLDTEFKKGSSAVIKLGDDGSAALGNVSKQMSASGTAATQAGGGFASMGSAGLYLAAAGVAVGVALAPVVVTLGAFAAGAAAVAGVMALAVGGIGALALGTVMLANAAGQINKPMADLQAHLKGMADALGKQAAPMAGLLLGFLDQLIPRIQSMGSQLLTWFGDRLPAIFKAASVFADIFLETIGELGAVFGRVIDYFIANAPRLENVFGAFASFAVAAVDGLVSNLLRLSDWFLARLPQFEPFISSIFGALGRAVQGAAQAFGSLADWTISHWPAIVSTISTIWTELARGWALVQPVFADLQRSLKDVQPQLDYIKAHAAELKPVLDALGIAAGLAVAALGGIAISAVYVVAALVWIATKVHEGVVEWIAAGRDIGDTMSRVGVIAHGYADTIGAVFSAVGGFLHTAVVQYQQAGRDIGDTFSRVGALAHTYANDIGSAFNQIGSAARGTADAVGNAFSQLGSKVHGGLEGARGVFNSFIGKVDGALGGFGVSVGQIPAFAKGGVVPGYAPGQDSILAALSPGEGVLTPQTVRGLGGAGAIDALNRSGGLLSGLHGLGAAISDVSALGSMVGSIMGQCVVFMEKLTGHFFPVAMASQMTSWINSRVPAPGEIFVSTLPPFGHTGLVIGPNRVMDSNWGLDERVRIHALSDIPNIAGYISGYFGTTGNLPLLGGLLSSAGASLGAILKGLLDPIASAAKAALGGIPEPWARGIVSGLIDKVVANIEGRAAGGLVVPGHLYTVGERGPELFSPSLPGEIIPNGGLAPGSGDRETKELLAAILGVLQQINGAPAISARSASLRFGT